MDWIRFSERKPDDLQHVLVCYRRDGTSHVWHGYYYERSDRIDTEGLLLESDQLVAWAEWPEPPNELA